MKFGICTSESIVSVIFDVRNSMCGKLLYSSFLRWCKIVVVITPQCIFLCHPANSLDFMRDGMMCEKES